MIEIIEGLDIDEYHAHEALSKTKIWYWHEVPPMAWRHRYVLGNHPKDKTHLAVGRALDTLIFDGQDDFVRRYKQKPEFYPDKDGVEKPWSGNANFCKAWIKQQNEQGVTVLSEADMDLVLGMHRAYKAKLDVSPQLKEMMNGQAQVTMRGWLPDFGIVQARPDLINFAGGYSIDLKSSRSIYAHERDFVKFGYHVQVALVDELARAAGRPLREHYHLVIEKSAWPRIRLMRIPQDLIDYGKAMARKLCSEIQDALANGFKEQPVMVEDLVVPPWIQDRVVHGEELRSQQFFGEADELDWDNLVTGE